ncbi:MAG: hypothetical protein AAGF97_07495, partial [Planctomycetota bacterium]
GMRGRSSMVMLAPLVLVAFLVLFLAPILVDRFSNSPPGGLVWMLLGIVLAVPTGLILVTGAYQGHWLPRLGWFVFIASLALVFAAWGLRFTRAFVDGATYITMATMLGGVIWLALNEGFRRFRPAACSLRRKEVARIEQLSLSQLFACTSGCAMAIAILVRLHPPSTAMNAEFFFAMLLGAGGLLLATLNGCLCLPWAFANRETVMMFPLLGPFYTVLVVGMELIGLSLLTGASMIEGTTPLMVLTGAQLTALMAGLLYLRWCGWEWKPHRAGSGDSTGGEQHERNEIKENLAVRAGGRSVDCHRTETV